MTSCLTDSKCLHIDLNITLAFYWRILCIWQLSANVSSFIVITSYMISRHMLGEAVIFRPSNLKYYRVHIVMSPKSNSVKKNISTRMFPVFFSFCPLFKLDESMRANPTLSKVGDVIHFLKCKKVEFCQVHWLILKWLNCCMTAAWVACMLKIESFIGKLFIDFEPVFSTRLTMGTV